MKTLPSVLGLLVLVLLSSCGTLPISERAFISQPGMLFDGTGAYRYDCGIISQIETGRAVGAGAAGGGCASCH